MTIVSKKAITLLVACTAVGSAWAQSETDTLESQKLDEVVVAGVRAPKNAPFAVSNVQQKDLTGFSKQGRELPLLLSHTPGVVAWGENGLGTGAAAMRIRGAAGSRINVTLDGVALNSPEDQSVFWANMNSYASLLQSVQVQRGIGTSTNGDGAFGGAISMQTEAVLQQAGGEISGSYGSYNTYNVGGKIHFPIIADKLFFLGAYHETGTDGYVHGTEGRSGSYFGTLLWLPSTQWRISYKNLGNFEKTGQAWNGVITGSDDLSLYEGTYGVSTGITSYKDLYNKGLGRYNTLYERLQTNPDGSYKQDAAGNYLTERYRYRNGSPWDKTTDNFYQNHNILSLSWRPNPNWSHSLTLHYTYGYGYYNEFRYQNKLKKFGLTFTNAAGQEVKRSDFIRKKGMSQHTYGAIYTTNYHDAHWNILGSINLQQFRAHHFGYLTYIADPEVDAAFRPNNANYQYYGSKAVKKDYSGYIKAGYQFARYWNAFADVQYRFVDYTSDGNNDKFYENPAGGYTAQVIDIDKRYHFLNPKVGLSFTRNGHKAYASLAIAHREPERNNFTDNGSYPAPSPERLTDWELGYQYTGRKWSAGANFYYMLYHNQFVQTGQKSDIGESLTTNIPKSYRMGIELEAAYRPFDWLSFEGNAALSRNRIKDFDEMASVDFDDSFRKIHYGNTAIAFSPSALLNGFVNFHFKGIDATWHTNFVSKQYLDNTENDQRSLPCYSQTDINLTTSASRLWKNFGERKANGHTAFVKDVLLGLNFNNIFNRHYAASGWVYSSILDGSGHPNEQRYTEIGYFPMAGFNFMGSVTLQF